MAGWSKARLWLSVRHDKILLMSMEKIQLLIAGESEAALRAEKKAKELQLQVERVGKAQKELPPAIFQIDASEDAWLARRRSAFCRNDRELRAETGEENAPEEPSSETTPWRVMGDFIYSANDIAARLRLPDTTIAGGLPLRALYSWSVGNLFLAGTCVSCTACALDLLQRKGNALALAGDMSVCAVAVGLRNKQAYHRVVYGNYLEEFLALASKCGGAH